MKNILIFYQNSNESVFIRTLIEYYARENKVYFISLSPVGFIHKCYKNNKSIQCFSFNNEKNILKNIISLILFCRKYSIDIVFPHLQRANLIALLSQYFIHAKVIPTRHHVDDVRISKNRNAIIQDYLVNLISRKIIVLSQTAKKDLIDNEGVQSHRIIVSSLVFNFNLYEFSDSNLNKQNIGLPNSAKILMSVGRLVANKRLELSIQLLHKLLEVDDSFYLVIIGDGPKKKLLENLCVELNINSRVVFLGNIDLILSYINIADWIIHPSISESSNQVVKEAGILRKPVIVCKDVGDFSEYLIHLKNSVIVSKNNFIEESYKQILNSNQNFCNEIGNSLHSCILNRFSIENNSPLSISKI